MNFISTSDSKVSASFDEAVFLGLPDANGLYMPEYIPRLPSDFFNELGNQTLENIAYKVLHPFVAGSIDDQALMEIVSDTLSFPIPLTPIHDGVFSLELFHGPTLAFKDVGARFLARTLGYFAVERQQKTTVLVATSGDTGSAVAHGFFNVPNVDVVVLYPKGKVSDFQRKQMTTLGNNIQAIEIDGVFDDCQNLVKKAFLDSDLKQKRSLTSANSINVARFLPQMVYYFWAMAQIQSNYKERTQHEIYFSVPSGNFGNITAGLFAQRMGLGITGFIAAANSNDTFPKYLETGTYEAKSSVATLSNAMDVGDPSNVRRIQDLFSHDIQTIREHIQSKSYTDKDCLNAIYEVYKQYNYTLDPHGAIAYNACELAPQESLTIILETAHPIKFKEVVESVIPEAVPMPAHLDAQPDKESKHSMSSDFNSFKEYLLS